MQRAHHQAAPHQRRAPPTARPDGAIDLRWLREQYQDCKRSLKDIAAETGIPVEALAAAARQAGTPCAGHPGQPGMADSLIFGCYQEVPVFTFREIPNFPVLDLAFAHGIGFMWPCVRTIMKHAPPGPAGIVLFG